MLLRRSRTFRTLWTGQVVSVVGDGMQRVALLWWAGQTGGTTLVTAVALASMLPLIAGSPLGGWAADRFSHARLLIGADLVRLASSAALAAVLIAPDPSRVAVCLLVACTSIGTAVFDPTYAATVPTVVSDEDLPNANGLNLANSAVGSLAGPLLGGVLIGVGSVGAVMVVNAATFAWSAWWITRTRLPVDRGTLDEAPAGPDRTISSTRTSARAVLRDPVLRRLIGVASVLNCVVGPVPVLVVALSVDELGLGPRGYTMLAASLAAGMLAGSFLAGVLARIPRVASMTVVGATLAAAGSLPPVAVGVALGLCGVAIAAVNVSLLTTFQRDIPAAVRGRVFGVMGSLGEGLRPLGLAAAAPLIGAVGVSVSFLAVGVGVAITALTWGRAALIGDGSRATSHVVGAGLADAIDRIGGQATSVARPARQRLA